MNHIYLFLAIGLSALFIASYVWLNHARLNGAEATYLEKTVVTPIAAQKNIPAYAE